MKKILLGVSAAMMVAGSAFAQDAHFTQYFASPMTLNPALTGLTQCDLRLAANYRQQWGSVSANPYTSGTISYDMSTLKGKLNNGDAVGVGLLVLYDKSGLGSLQNITVGLSAAYHKAFGSNKQHNISLGFQGQLVQKNIDFTKLQFEDQYDPATGYASYITTENLGNSDVNYPDFNAGIMYSGRVSEHATAYVGFSYYHLTQPVESFLDGNNRIHSRYTGYLGGAFDLNERSVLYTSALYQSQAKATEMLLGAAIGWILNPGHDEEFQKNTIFYLGAWYRIGDAIAPYIAFEWSKMQLGISYDVNVSNFAAATRGMGAYELSLIFNGCINKREKGPNYNFSCPKF